LVTQAPRILIAPACFKGSLPAPAVADLVRDFLQEHLPADVVLDVCPVADGGDDTLSVLQATDPGFAMRQVQVTGPIAEMRVMANYLVHGRKKLVVVEAAQAHGLKLLPANALAPLEATSYGVGELIQYVMTTERPGTILVALGGSASTDGGMGALQALSGRFLNELGAAIQEPMNGRLLGKVQQIEWLPTWHFSGQVLIATDVANPLLGPEGTAMVFAPQKGATQEQCQTLEANLTHMHQLMRHVSGVDYAALPGAGAAGGLAYGLRHLPHAGIVSGSQWIAEQLDLLARIAKADVILTGEGRFDATSFGGKATGNIVIRAREKPVMVVCGQAQDNLAYIGRMSIYPLVQAGESAEMAMAHPEAALKSALQEMLPGLREALSG
jgi:glycerate kinase